MPGSLLNLQDIHSNLSDVSAKSVDSRTSGKKVSFNKAVRVKQYPWQPDDYGERNGTITLPNQRFWFKVYKNNSNQENPNSWKERIFPTEENTEDTLDSLMPIAEDDDTYSEANQNDLGDSHSTRFDESRIFPPDPPVDYTDDDVFTMQSRKDRLMNGGVALPGQNKTLEKGLAVKKENANGLLRGSKLHDFKRPTISSAAKCINESKIKSSGTKQATSSVRLPRAPTREYMTERTIRESPKLTSACDRRSRSTDNSNERVKLETSRVDKAVSTDDLTSDYKENQENLNKDKFWWRKKTSRDKATQHNGTFTKSRLSNILDRVDTPSVRPALSSASNQLRWNKRESSTQKEYSLTEKEKAASTKKENYSNENKFHALESKTLALRGRNCISSSKRSNGLIKHDTSTLDKWRMLNNESKASNSDTFEYDYVTKETPYSMSDRNVCTQVAVDASVDALDRTRRSLPWRPIINRDVGLKAQINHSSLSERAKDIHGLSDSEFIRETEITDDVDVPTISIPKVKNSLTGDLNNVHYKSDSKISRGRHQFQLRSANRERSASTDRQFGRADHDQSMIDWSLSGFQFGAREDNKISSSSDSECVVHRRPPLLMYIPGVSHHNRPAIEDDRLSALSGISRSEAEDEISPLMYEFKRRHSMPRNGKANWWKWKASKKHVQQT